MARQLCILANQVKIFLFFIQLLVVVEVSPSPESKNSLIGCEPEGLLESLTEENSSYTDDVLNTCLKLINDSFPLRIMTFNVKNYYSPRTDPFNPSNKKDRQRAERGEAIAKIILADNADVVALQELRDVNAAPTITKYLNKLKDSPNFYDFIQSGPLPPSGSRHKEWYAFIYRTNITQPNKWKQFPPLINGSFTQRRPPFAVEFQLNLGSGHGHLDFTIASIHTSPDSSRVHTTRWEIDHFHSAVIGLVNKPLCYSANLIVLGDFNQSPRYVLTKWQSKFDKDPQFLELSYTGSSSVIKDLTKDNRLDRIYVYKPFSVQQAVQNVTADGGFVFINRNSPFFNLKYNKKTSDHFPLSFVLDMGKVGTTFYTTQCCSINSTQRRQETNESNTCHNCSTAVLTGGVYPCGSLSSTQAFGICPSPIRRGDADFTRLGFIIGSAFIFVDSERNASWCGSPGQECLDCRRVSDESILNQCSDRIMCPTLVDKMLDLFQKVQDCAEENRSIIIHEAWDEPDSVYPNGESPVESLHSSGQEAKISLSVPLEEIIIEKDYDSDPLLLDELASLAVCVGFEFVKINSVSNTVSVAMSECFDQQNANV